MPPFLRFGPALALLALALPGCAASAEDTPYTVDGVVFPSEDAALDHVRQTHASELAQVVPVAAHAGGTLLIVLPTPERILSGLGPASQKLMADTFSENFQENAESVERARIFDSVTITRSAAPEQQPQGDFHYKLWVVPGPGTTVQWFLSRGGAPKQLEFKGLPQNTRPTGVRWLNYFDALVINTAADLGAPVARQALPELGPTTGTGFFINASGAMLTNNHVVDGCTSIKVKLGDGAVSPAMLVDADRANDLAVIQVPGRNGPVAEFRATTIRQGEDVVVYGFPLAGVLSSGGNLSVGIVSALSGLKDDPRQVQISAPVQRGNSGGPVFDSSGNVAAIATSKLDTLGFAETTHDIAQNVNFAIKAAIAQTFLDANGIAYATALSKTPLHTEDIGDRARSFTNMILCQH